MVSEIAPMSKTDVVAEKLTDITQYILVIVFGLLPILFVPTGVAPFEYSKVMFVIIGLFLALILYSLSILRTGTIKIALSHPLILLWVVVGVTLLSAIFSGDFRDALIGNLFEIHTTLFVGLIALTTTMWALVGFKKKNIVHLYMLFAVSTIVLVVFHILRLILGADFLTFDVFTQNVSTPIGSWNDLALFLGLIILLSIIALEQLLLTLPGKLLFGGIVIGSLLLLMVINFSFVWAVLGIVSFAVVIYKFGSQRLGLKKISHIHVVEENNDSSFNLASFLVSIVVLIVSIMFFFGSSTLGTLISNTFNISYVEVRPSVEATIGIARGVYNENAFLGIGPNRFADAWQLYKNDTINDTIFWNTDFNGANGYIPTFFVTTGVVGAIAWILFLGFFVVYGIRFLMRTKTADRMWYFIASSAFVSAVYVWLMAVLYIPGPAILLIGAVCTGLVVIASCGVGDIKIKELNLGSDRRAGFILTLIVIGVIVGSVSALYSISKHYASAYEFNRNEVLIRKGESADVVNASIARAFSLSQDDRYMRRAAEYELTRINLLLQLTEVNEKQQQAFQEAIVSGVGAGKRATELDETNADNWAVLGNIYSVLAGARVEQTYDLATAALMRARDLDPHNPLHYLNLAQLEARVGNDEAARNYANEAINKKQNYSEALFFLTQLDIRTGNVDAAIETAEAIISLEPRNPARYYQLGVLYSAQGDTEKAIGAFETAISLDKNYANARYFLALAYDTVGRPEDARAQLEEVLRLNPGNEDVMELIDQLNRTGSLSESISQTAEPTSNETEVENEDEEPVVTETEVDTSLITPVNALPENVSDEEAENSESVSNQITNEEKQPEAEDTQETVAPENGP